MESLKEKTAKGLFWGAMNNTVQQLLGVAFGIVTLRLLSPQDNGMMAIIAGRYGASRQRFPLGIG